MILEEDCVAHLSATNFLLSPRQQAASFPGIMNATDLLSLPLWNARLDPVFHGQANTQWRENFVSWCDHELHALWQLAVEKELSYLFRCCPLADRAVSLFESLVVRVRAIAASHVAEKTMSERQLKNCIRSFIICYIEHKVAYCYAFLLATRAYESRTKCDENAKEHLFQYVSTLYPHRSACHDWKRGWDHGWQSVVHQ